MTAIPTIDLSVIRPGSRYVFAEHDFDRGEPVCLTVITGCKAWLDIFTRELDLYQVIANDIYELGVDITQPTELVKAQLSERVSSTMRDVVKISVLAIMYDESPRAFAYRSGISLDTAEHFYSQFYIKYPEILAYKKNIRRMVSRQETVETLFGRRRSTYLAKTGDKWQDQRNFNSLVRKAINFPVQSLLADITCIKAYEVVKWIVDNELDQYVQVVNVVHDSLWLLVHEDLLPQVQKIVKMIMEDMTTLPAKFEAPLKCSSKLGYTLAEMKDEYKLKDGKEVGWWATYEKISNN